MQASTRTRTAADFCAVMQAAPARRHPAPQQHTSACAEIAARCCCRGTPCALLHSLFKRVTTCCRIRAFFGGGAGGCYPVMQTQHNYLWVTSAAARQLPPRMKGKHCNSSSSPVLGTAQIQRQLPSHPLLSLLFISLIAFP